MFSTSSLSSVAGRGLPSRSLLSCLRIPARLLPDDGFVLVFVGLSSRLSGFLLLSGASDLLLSIVVSDGPVVGVSLLTGRSKWETRVLATR